MIPPCRSWWPRGVLLFWVLFAVALPAKEIHIDRIPINLKLHNVSLRQALEEVSRQSGVNFVYNDALVDSIRVSCECTQYTLRQALDFLLKDTGIRYRVINRQIVLIGTQKLPTRDVRGYVYDAYSKEPLPYANAYLEDTRFGSSSNTDGYFVLVGVPEGPYMLRVDYLGYQSWKLPITVNDSLPSLRVELVPDIVRGESVTVTEENWKMLKLTAEPAEVRFSPHQLSVLPIIGEEDVFRGLQLLPGVSTINDGSAGLYIRGGTPSQNLILLDGMTIYHVNHFFGFLSAFNASAIKSIRVYKGGFPARYGGRTSGVVELTGKAGSTEEVQFGTGANFLGSRAYLSLPFKQRGSLSMFFRRSINDMVETPLYRNVVDHFLRQEEEASGSAPGDEQLIRLHTPGIYFHDLNIRLTLNPGQRDRVALSFYNGRDDVNIDEDFTFLGIGATDPSWLKLNRTSAWGNVGFSGKWSRVWNNRFYSRLLLAYSTYFTRLNDRFTQQDPGNPPFAFASGNENRIKNSGAYLDTEWHLSPGNTLQMGLALTDAVLRYYLKDEASRLLIDQRREAFQVDGYVQHTWTPMRGVQLIGGIRGAYYQPLGRIYPEPRLSFSVKPARHWQIRGAWGHYHQFVKRIINEEISERSRDFWLLSDAHIPPEFAEHLILGVDFEKGGYRIDVEGYYKKLRELTEFSLNYVDDRFPLTGERLFLTGRGQVWGIEFLAQKQSGRLSGWAGYTLSLVEHQFPRMNHNNPFPADQDQRHEIKLAGNLTLGKWNLSATWIYTSGRPYTAPENLYFISLLDGTVHRNVNIGDKNDARLVPYHRLDVGVSYRDQIRSTRVEMGFSVFNVYNRKNVWYRKYNLISTPILVRDIRMLGITPNLYFKVDFQ